MSILDGEERLHNTLTGEVSYESVARPHIKLNTRPRIMACIPVGTKDQANLFETPDGNRWLTNAVSAPGCVPVPWVFAQMKLVAPLGTMIGYVSQRGMLSGEARQIMTMKALEMVQDDGYILYWDDDIIVEPMTLYTLYSFMEQHPEAGLVTAVYSTRQDPTEPVIYKEHMKGPHWGLTVGPDAKPEEIFSAGAGFMLCRVQAIRDMIAKNPKVPIWADSKALLVKDAEGAKRGTHTFGHDIRFCILMAEAGWKLYVDGRVEVGHYDIQSNREFRLPEDSPPKRRGRRTPPAPPQDDSICLILPTYGHLDYAEKAARSFREHTKGLRTLVCAVDDGSPGVTDEEFAAWAKRVGVDHAHRFPENDGLTRSWNYGLRFARDHGIKYAVCGNSDLIFSPGWSGPIVEALADHELVGPVTNAAGWGTDKQRVAYHLGDDGFVNSDAPEAITQAADALQGMVPTDLDPGFDTTYGRQGATVHLREFLNGFCLVARTDVWWAGAFDDFDVFDPSHKLTENETELQIRWTIGMRARRAVVPASYVFHYRSISRGDAFKCAGAFRPEDARVAS